MNSLYSNQESSSISSSNITLSPDSSLQREFQEQVKIDLQKISDEIDRVKKHDYNVIEKLSHDCHIFSVFSLIFKLYLIPIALLFGIVFATFLLYLEIQKFPFINWIYGTISIGSIATLLVYVKKLPDSIETLENKFTSIEREHNEIKNQIDFLKEELAALKVNCKDKHSSKRTRSSR